jgi:hypothetical protein
VLVETAPVSSEAHSTSSISPHISNIDLPPLFPSDMNVLSTKEDSSNRIPVILSNRSNIINRRQKLISEPRVPIRKTIRRSNNLVKAANLPTVINLNARSVYNKVDEFCCLVEQYEADVVVMCETWERQNLTLDQIINIENFKIITNVVQRTNAGGKTAIFVNEDKYFVKEICPNPITVPIGVEAVWTLIMPKSRDTDKQFKQIVIGSIYSKPNSRKKSVLIDHICETFHFLRGQYGSDLHFLIAGDTNEMKLDSILDISSDIKQVVTDPTRGTKMLDPVFTTMSKYYQTPKIKPPLDNDPDNNGRPSDHKIVLLQPISNLSFVPGRTKKNIVYRPLPQSGIERLGNWVQSQDWEDVYRAVSAHEKAEVFHNQLIEKLNECLPEKTLCVSSDDKPWVTGDVKLLDRQRKREFNKNKKSNKWSILDSKYRKKCQEAKKNYYENIVKDLKTSRPGQWYSKLKRMSTHDQMKDHETVVLDLIGMPDIMQVEKIADQFASVSQIYDPLVTEDIITENFEKEAPPKIDTIDVYQKIKSIKNKKSATVPGDIPMKIISEFAYELSFPLADIINRSLTHGEYPEIWKVEYVTPVPKAFPPKSTNQLRKIAGTKNFSKIFEKIIAELMLSDMKDNMDPSQYGNQNGLSVQHYLVMMLNKILTSLDKNSQNESMAVILNLIDWSQAFDRQCPNLGVKSFIENGVRKSLIPVLINYFQNRVMYVKWHGVLSKKRDLPGGGPQGCSMGIIEYLSLSSDSANFVDPSERYKFVDDCSILELVNLISVGLSSFNFHNQVASDIGIDQYFVHPQNLKSQSYLNQISEWTHDKKMKLNEEKTKIMIFNQSMNYQFTTRLTINEQLIDIINETELLGVVISSDLTFKSNTKSLVKRAFRRTILLHKLFDFSVPMSDLINIYILFIRSILEQSCVVWNSSITQEEEVDIERVQKVCLRIILKENYIGYTEALEKTKLATLVKRREKLCLNFAKKCVQNEKTQHMFPLNPSTHSMPTRHHEKFKVQHSRTERLAKSSIPYLQRLLNEYSG